jgi:rhomboid protease GluP
MARSRTVPIATLSLIAVNLLVFVIGFLGDTHIQIIRDYGFIPDSLFNPNGFQREPSGDLNASLLRLFASMFVHAGIVHIAFNLAALWYVGSYAESSIGSTKYVTIYFASGIFAALFHGIVASYLLGSGQTLLIGASGAISGILGIAAATGNRRAYYWLILQVVFAFIGSVSAIPIAFTAHIGGFLAGVAFTKFLVRKRDVSRPESERMEEGEGY